MHASPVLPARVHRPENGNCLPVSCRFEGARQTRSVRKAPFGKAATPSPVTIEMAGYDLVNVP